MRDGKAHTLDQVGNWANAKLDLTGNGQYGGADEYDDTRTHDVANELLARDIISRTFHNKLN